jgi:hypothetical protein
MRLFGSIALGLFLLGFMFWFSYTYDYNHGFYGPDYWHPTTQQTAPNHRTFAFNQFGSDIVFLLVTHQGPYDASFTFRLFCYWLVLFICIIAAVGSGTV